MNAITERAEIAMTECLARADRINAGLWSAKAHELLVRYLKTAPNGFEVTMTFLTEQFVDWATWRGLAVPPDPRAIGGIMRAAAKAGIIVRAGYRQDRWGSIKTAWRAA
jgi:hypothetical protein